MTNGARVLFALVALGLPVQAQLPPAASSITLKKVDGGPAELVIGYDSAINKGSTLHRRWFVVNDNSCPIALENLGIQPYDNKGNLDFVPKGTAYTINSVLAFEIVFATFDVWGERLHNFSLMHVEDIPAGQPLPVKDFSWRGTYDDVRRYFSAVSFVNKVMTADGKIWRADTKRIAQKLDEVQLRVSEAGLDRDDIKGAKR